MKLFNTFFCILWLIEFLSAQNVDSIHISIPSDSSTTSFEFFSDSLKSDSIKIAQQKISNAALDELWLQFQLNSSFDHDTNAIKYYHFDNLINTNYTGVADILRNKPEFQVYDFFSMGYPRYVALNNLLPHQTGIFLNGYALNDPIHGMFNTHMISLDGIDEVNNQIGVSTYGYGNGIDLKSRAINSLKEPYSRVMFRQGDFSYTDLDISFSRKLSDKFSVNLGGINKIYHGDYDYGFQYRGGLYFRFIKNIYSQTIINIDREKLINSNNSSYNLYRYREYRHDINSSIYYITDPECKERWKLDIGYTRIRRKNDSQADSATAFLNRRRADQYSFGLDRNLHIGKLFIDASVFAYQNKIWGSSFLDKLTDTGINSSMEINYFLTKWLQLDGDFKIGYLVGQDLSWSPELNIRFDFNPIWLKLNGNRLQRFPYRNERSIYFNQYRGNRDLKLESIESYSTTVGYSPFNNLNLKAKGVSNKISNEILFDSTSFYNGRNRKFNYIHLNAKYSLYKFALEISGHLSDAKINLSPKKSFSGQLCYRDVWLKGSIIIDAIGSFHWYDVHNSIYYNPIVERLYWTNTETDGYYYFSYKIAATVKSAQIYVAMDNPMSYDYEYISGYQEFYRRVRFGINWVLMD